MRFKCSEAEAKTIRKLAKKFASLSEYLRLVATKKINE